MKKKINLKEMFSITGLKGSDVCNLVYKVDNVMRSRIYTVSEIYRKFDIRKIQVYKVAIEAAALGSPWFFYIKYDSCMSPAENAAYYGFRREFRLSTLITEIPNSKSEMHRYGYQWDRMIPVNKKAALHLYRRGIMVYKLYPDNTEAEADDLKDIFEHEGLYGIEMRQRRYSPILKGTSL